MHLLHATHANNSKPNKNHEVHISVARIKKVLRDALIQVEKQRVWQTLPIRDATRRGPPAEKTIEGVLLKLD